MRVVLGNNRLVAGPQEKINAVAVGLVSSGRVVPALDADRATGR